MIPFQITNEFDQDGNPSGGLITATGLSITWQRGPVTPENPENGAQVEDVIKAAIFRLEFFQRASSGKFACAENSSAIEYLTKALGSLHARTAARMRRKVEGSYTP